MIIYTAYNRLPMIRIYIVSWLPMAFRECDSTLYLGPFPIGLIKNEEYIWIDKPDEKNVMHNHL